MCIRDRSMSLNVEVQDGNKDDVSFLFSQALEEAVIFSLFALAIFTETATCSP